VNDHDHSTLVLDAVEDGLDGVTMPTSAREIVAAGRARRRNRRALEATGVVAVAAIIAGVSMHGGGVGGNSTDGVHIRTIAYSVDSQPDGTVKATWSKQRYFDDHDGLEKALRDAGFPVVMKSGEFCKAPGASDSELDASGVGAGVGDVMHGDRDAEDEVIFTFDPAQLPADTELFIGYFTPEQRAANGRVGSIERLVPQDTALTCTTVVPTLG
jgi:hypothetical protein